MSKKDPGDTPPVDDWLPGDDEIVTVCPKCKSDDILYIGEAFEEDHYIGSSYDCLDCGHRFQIHDYNDG